jgi:hypothetical protein
MQEYLDYSTFEDKGKVKYLDVHKNIRVHLSLP